MPDFPLLGIAPALNGNELVPVWSYQVTTDEPTTRTTTGAIAALAASQGGVAVVTRVLTQAQILASFSSPPVLLPSPGTNSYYWVFGTSYALLYGGTPYMEPALNGVLYGSAAGQAADGGDNSILTATASQVYTGASFSGSFFAASGFLNQPLVYGNGSANPTGGNGSLAVSVAYAIVTLP
jgi:hypothetical protein